jgi:Ca2+-transporting ATPase
MTTSAGTPRAPDGSPPIATDAARWHAGDLAEVRRLLAVRDGRLGLDAAEVAARRVLHGPNALPAPMPPGLAAIVLHQLRSPLIYILLAAAAVALAMRDYVDTGFILLVVLVNTALGTWQEWRAEQSAAHLQRLITIRARVVREGRDRLVDAIELVPGDLVRLESGQRVPADLRLVELTGLAIDESLLTGESVAIDKDLTPRPADASVGDRRNMAFAGSTVMSGRGLGLVVATGTHTQVGAIAEAVSSASAAKPPLVMRLERFAQQISVVVLVVCIGIVAVGMARGMPWLEVFLLAVALAVSAIPEGLPVSVTVALSIATHRMSRRQVIVRRLTAVEGLGSCTAIASDKTGTLTVNQQTMRRAVLATGVAFEVTGEGYRPEGEVQDAEGRTLRLGAHPGLDRVARAVVLSSEGVLRREGDRWEHDGDAVDVALLAFAAKLGLDPMGLRAEAEIVGTIPFESEHAFAATFVREGDRERVLVKGALEVLLPRCTHRLGEVGEEPLDTTAVQAAADALSDAGYRVLAVADGVVTSERARTVPGLDGLVLLGLVALIDPPRPEAREAVARCQQAGITVSMVTGDHPRTALAISRALGIADSAETVVTGAQLTDAGPPDGTAFDALVRRGRVFARVAPLQKLHIVDALRRLGHFVAVTGDGVNDAPALKRANIGVAMGSGTDVTKDTASLIITDDRFASIEAGVEEGRIAYDNIRKVTWLLVSTGAAEVILLLLALVSGLPLPLMAVQLLWLNLVTNGIQDKALAFESGEADIMERPPREPGEGIFNPVMIRQVLLGGVSMGAITFGMWAWLLAGGADEASARNQLLLLFVLLQNLHVFNCRSERRSAFAVSLTSNPLLLLGVLGAQGVHLLAMHVPVMQRLLGVGPVTGAEWLRTLAAASLILGVSEVAKWFRRRQAAGRRVSSAPALARPT